MESPLHQWNNIQYFQKEEDNNNAISSETAIFVFQKYLLRFILSQLGK